MTDKNKNKKIVITEDTNTGNWSPDFGDCTIDNAFQALQVTLICFAEAANVSAADLMVMLDASFKNCADHMPDALVFENYEEKQFSKADILRVFEKGDGVMRLTFFKDDYEIAMLALNVALKGISDAYGKSAEQILSEIKNYDVLQVPKDTKTILS